ncbi:MAG: Nif3-like dinuclear metal center hexameric protein [Clostridia bacterium]|nr:Nif3-like dinuclear metal center hexameric protein [Clostridia bacterium]
MRDPYLKDERLRAVYELIGQARIVADIGCDHGFLSAALLKNGRAERVIASDISGPSVQKAMTLAENSGLSGKMEVVRADGLSAVPVVEPGLKIAICGMGGELIARILENGREAAESAELIVMQPMRGEAELREYLFSHGYGTVDERVVFDSGRYYQVISAKYGVSCELPEGFPPGFMRFGPVMASRPEPMLLPLLKHYRAVYEGELRLARQRGREPEPLLRELENTDRLITFVERRIKPMLLSTLLDAMESIAPRELALEFDNPGLIVGTKKEHISRVLVALDCTLPVVEEAKALSCDMVLTHHPLLFRAVKSISPQDPVTAPVWELIRNDIAMFAAHTNLDSAEGGVNTTLCRMLGIENERPVPPEDLCRVGELKEPCSFSELARRVETILGTRVRVSGSEKPVRRVMVCGGSGGSEYRFAAAEGADVLVTGEAKHNEAIESSFMGVNLIVAGHFETERIVLPPLIERLRELYPGAEFILSKSGTALRPLD